VPKQLKVAWFEILIKPTKPIFIVFLILVYLTGQWGCATGRDEYPKPLLEKYRENLGTILVVTSQDVPIIQPDKHPSEMGVFERMGQGASEGVEKTGGWMWEGCKDGWTARYSGDSGLGVLLLVAGLTAWCILSVPVGILGGIGGFFYGPSPPTFVEETEATLQDILAEYPTLETFESTFLKRARARTSHTFVVVSEMKQPTFEALNEVLEEGHTDKELPTYEGLVGQGLDTILELTVKKSLLKRVEGQEEEVNSPMLLALFVRARLVRLNEETVWYDQTFAHKTYGHFYTEWKHHQSLTFKDAIEQAYQILAEQIVQKLFHETTSVRINPATRSIYQSTKDLIGERGIPNFQAGSMPLDLVVV
jgi:hypothetical protein